MTKVCSGHRDHMTKMATTPRFCMLAFRYKEMKIYQYGIDHMTKMASMSIFGKKKPSKIFNP